VFAGDDLKQDGELVYPPTDGSFSNLIYEKLYQ